MTVYVDEIRQYPKGHWSHMWSDVDLFRLHLEDFGIHISMPVEVTRI